jgi:putative peptidoglycan lipid II flippase
MLAKMGPAVFSVAAAQISLLINTTIAASLAAGAVSALQYADRLMELPTALLGVALGTILLPGLAKANTEGDTREYSSLLDWGLRLTFLLSLPAAVGLATLAEPMIATLFHYGAFDNGDVVASSLPLMAYSAGLLGFILVKTLAPAFFARQDVRTPVRIAVIVLVLTQLMNLAFVPLFKHAGLTLSISIGALINATWLFIGLRRSGQYQPAPGWGVFALRVVFATALLGALLGWAGQTIDWVRLGVHSWQRAAWLAACLGGAAVLYFGALLATGLKLRDFMRRG